MNSIENLYDAIQVSESDIANSIVGNVAAGLLGSGAEPIVVADAMVIRALAIVAAESGDEAGARDLLKQWHSFSNGK